METISGLDPSEYIKQKSDVLNEKSLNRYRLDDDQYHPYVDAMRSDYDLEQNFEPPEIIDARRGDLRLHLATEELEKDEEGLILREAQRSGHRVKKVQWGRLNDMVLIKGDPQDREGRKKLRISAEVGDHCKIFINRFTKNHDRGLVQFTPGRNIIIFNGDPVYPTALLGLMHEIGHFKAWEKMDRLQKVEYLHHINDFRQNVDSMTVMLNKERTAWAYALAKLRPFLAESEEDFSEGFVATRQFALDYIHQVCLRTYGEVGLKILEQVEGEEDEREKM